MAATLTAMTSWHGEDVAAGIAGHRGGMALMRRSSDVQVLLLGSETGLVAVAWMSRTRPRMRSRWGEDEAVKHG
jgi:hypothetical protein